MPPTAPVRRRILQDLVTALRGINGGSSYFHDLTDSADHVVEPGRVPRDHSIRPLVQVYDDGDEKTMDDVIGLQVCTMRLILACAVHEGDAAEARDAVERFCHDVEKRLMVDHSRGGLAVDTHVAIADPGFSEETLPDILFSLRIEVEYRHGVRDPSAVTPSP